MSDATDLMGGVQLSFVTDVTAENFDMREQIGDLSAIIEDSDSLSELSTEVERYLRSEGTEAVRDALDAPLEEHVQNVETGTLDTPLSPKPGVPVSQVTVPAGDVQRKAAITMADLTLQGEGSPKVLAGDVAVRNFTDSEVSGSLVIQPVEAPLSTRNMSMTIPGNSLFLTLVAVPVARPLVSNRVDVNLRFRLDG